ncbi:MAG: primase [Actinomycetota bacterium]|nr:primase [Actinomycetota bacterium]
MAKIKDEDIEALRDKADIVEVISQYTSLKKSGGHTFKGLCPFHSEKTPSFTVDTSRNLYYCFGCSKGGNIYHFVQEMESLPFPEAVEWLARKFNFELHYEEQRPGEAKFAGVKARIIEANRVAADFFHTTLMTSPDALQARRYLESRGFGKDVAERWELGYSPGRDSLCKHLFAKGFKQDEIEKADLARVSERDQKLYDFFRQRIMFPTWNLQGDVIAFGARAIGDQQPKYLNTSETPAFSKSRAMYGLNRAKSAISRNGVAIVVEGYTDVIALHEAGIHEAIATNGTALGESHFELLKKFADRAVLMFDADEAGKGATERGFGIHHRIGLEVLVAPLPAGRDPADVVSEDGPDGIRKVIDGGQSLLEFKLEQTISKLPLDTPEARSHAVRESIQVLRLHPDPIARHEYVFMVASRIGVDPDVVQRAVTEERGPSESGGQARERDRRLPGHVKVEREALQLLLTRTRETREWAEEVEETNFTSPVRREVFRRAMAAATEGVDGASRTDGLSPEALSLLTELTVGAAPLPNEELQPRLREVFTRLQVFPVEREIKTRRDALHKVNPVEHPEQHDQSFTELVQLEARRRDLLRRIEEDS